MTGREKGDSPEARHDHQRQVQARRREALSHRDHQRRARRAHQHGGNPINIRKKRVTPNFMPYLQSFFLASEHKAVCSLSKVRQHVLG